MMNTLSRMMFVVSGCAILTSAAGAGAQEWPQWRGANRDAKASGFTAPKTWPNELTQKWKVNVGKGDATPALAGNKLYVSVRQGGGEVTLCLDATNGKELWRDQYDSLDATGAAARHSGPRSSPAVAEGKVVTHGVRGVISCLDASTGKLLWRKDDFSGVWPRFFTSSSPVLTDGLCIVQLGGEDNGGIVAYDLATGAQKWKWTGDGTAYASPALVNAGDVKAIATLTANNFVGLGVTDGKQLWQTPFPPQSRAYNAATPIVDGQTVIYAGAGRGTKQVRIESAGGGFVAKEFWSNPDNAVQFNTPVLRDGLIYGISQAGDIFCIRARDGQTLWTSAMGGRGGFGSIVDAGAVLMALAPQAELILFQPSDKEFTKLAGYKVADTEVYAYPVVVGNRIFVKDQDFLTLWTVE